MKMPPRLSILAIALSLCSLLPPATRAENGLQAIPSGVVGWLRLHDFWTVNDKLGAALQRIPTPGTDKPSDPLLKMLGDALPLGLPATSKDWESQGFDPRGDLAIYWLEASGPKMLFVVSVKDKAAAAKAWQSRGSFEEAKYRDTAYFHSDQGAFAFMDDAAIFSPAEADLKKAIDTFRKVNPSLPDDPNFTRWTAKLGGNACDLAGFLAVRQIVQQYLPLIDAAPESVKENPLVRFWLWFIQQPDNLNLAAALDTHGLKLDFFVGVKEQSPLFNFVANQPQSLDLLASLPKEMALAGGMTLESKPLIQGVKQALDNLTATNQVVKLDASAKEAFVRSTTDFLNAVGNRAVMGLQGGQGPLPNIVQIYEVKDEQAARDYMAAYPDHAAPTAEFYKAIGLPDYAQTMARAQAGVEETYEGTRIQSIVLMQELPTSLRNAVRLQSVVARSDQVRDENMEKRPDVKCLTSDGWKASWSPSGTQLAITKSVNSGLQIAELKDGKTTELSASGKDPIWSPDGRYIAYVDGENPAESTDSYVTEHVWVVKAAGGQPRRLMPGGFPSWSADGKRIFAHDRKSNQIMVIEVETEHAEPRMFFEKPLSWYPAISPDEKQVAFGQNGALIVLDRQTGKEVVNYPIPSGGGLLPAWSPDGKCIAYGGFNEDTLGLWVYNLETETAVPVAKGRYTMPAWSADGQKLAIDFRTGNTREIWIVPAKDLFTPGADTAKAKKAPAMSLWYAIKAGKMILSMGPEVTYVKKTLDVISGKAQGLQSVKHYTAVRDQLFSEANFNFVFAPISFFKWENQMQRLLPAGVLANAEPEIVLGVSAARREGGMAVRWYLSLDALEEMARKIAALAGKDK